MNDCPKDLKEADLVEVWSFSVNEWVPHRVYNVGFNTGDIYVVDITGDEIYMGSFPYRLDSKHHSWRRPPGHPPPALRYGVTCTGAYCHEHYPDQVYSENFKCYVRRTRYR